MADKLTLGQRLQAMKRTVVSTISNSLVENQPPAAFLKRGGELPSIQALRSFLERHSLSGILPYETFDNETGLFYNRDTVGFMLYANPATALSPDKIRVLNGIFNQAHPSETLIQVSLIADNNVDYILEQWASAKSAVENPQHREIFETLAKNRVDYLSGGKWRSLLRDQSLLIRNYHLVFSYSVPVPADIAPVDIDDDLIDKLSRNRDATIGTLRSAGMFAENMTPDLLINILNPIFNPKEGKQPLIQYDPENLIAEQVVSVDSALVVNSGGLSMVHNEKSYSILPYHVRQFPQRWPGYKNGNLIGSFLNNILRIGCPFIATMTVNCPDQVVQKGYVKAKHMRATQMADSPVAKYATQWADRKVDWQYTAEKVDNGNKLLDAFYEVVLIAPEGEEQHVEQSLLSIYGSFGWVLSRSRYCPLHAFLGALPMGLCNESKNALKMMNHFSSRISWNVTNLTPWIAEWKGTKTPMMLFTGRRGQLTYFDPFDNDKGNFNISCCATSGSGKSFVTQEWITSVLASGGRAFVIDAGHSYKNICELLDGTYLEFGDRNYQIILNPFSSIDENDAALFLEQLPMLRMLIGQMASPNDALSGKQKSVLEKAIMVAWNSKKSKATITDVVEALKHTSDDDGPMHHTGKDLATMLHSYTATGMYGRYFDGESNIDLNKTFVVLELDALNTMPELQSVVLLILMMRITQVMYLSKNKRQRKLCIIDEAWRLLGRGRSGEFIEEGYRVARKHGGSFATITQKISDYFTSETAKAAYMNSDFALYLRQKPEELTSAEKLGHIDNSDGKVDVLRSLETIQGSYSEIAISSPSGLSVVRFMVDPITEKLYSTKAEEVQFIREQVARGRPILDAISELIQQSKGR